MHYWGDDWPYWDDMNKMVERCIDLAESAGLDTCWIKEKFGTLRWYYTPQSDADAIKYRQTYATLVAEYPHLATEILSDSHGFKEYLVGLVDPATCEHKVSWSNDKDGSWCGVCGKAMIDYRFNGGHGAVLCRECRVIIDEGLSWDEAEAKWTGKDICDECKKKLSSNK